MPTPILKKLAPFEGVGPGQTATLELPIGPRYQSLILEGTVKPAVGQTATLATIMGLIKVLVNGKAQRQYTATELSELNPLNGEEFSVETDNLTTPGSPLGVNDTARFRLHILFGEPFRKSYVGDKMMAWPTLWPAPAGQQPIALGVFQIEVGIPATASVDGATLHRLEAFAEYDAALGTLGADGSPLFTITKFWRQTFTYTASGERFITTLPKRNRYLSMHFFAQDADPITRVRVKRDNDVLHDDIPKRINDAALVKAGINPAAIKANRYDVIFDRDDLFDSGPVMDGVSEFEVVLDLASAAAANKSITLITTAYGPRD